MIASPCKNCPEHAFGCKINCKEYKKFEADLVEYRKNRDKERLLNSSYLTKYATKEYKGMLNQKNKVSKGKAIGFI